MVRARGPARRTRSPRSCRKNGRHPAWHGRRERLSRAGRKQIERAAIAPGGWIGVKEGGTAGPPPAKARPPRDGVRKLITWPARRSREGTMPREPGGPYFPAVHA